MRIYGKNPVLEKIKSDPGSIKRLVLQKKTDLSSIVRAAKASHLDFESMEKDEFVKMSGNIHAQGVMAFVDDFEYKSLGYVLDRAFKNGDIPVFLDGVTDPQNLGAIIRSLACLGGFSIVIPEHNSAAVNETVLRVACGGENYISIAQIPNCVKGVTAAKNKGFWIAGAVAGPGSNIWEKEIQFPVALVMGSEGKGIRPGLMKVLDGSLSIPMRGAELSFNVSVATALVCYEIIRRKDKLKGTG